VAGDGRERDRLGVDPEPVGLDSQQAQVPLHAALAIEQRRVLALAGRERLNVVGELALQVLGGLAAAQDQLRALGAIDQPRTLAQQPVLPVELDRRLGAHGTSVRSPCIFSHV
jgi:hypothetical protein